MTVAQILAHVGLWLPLTVIGCTLAVASMRSRRNN